MEIVDNIGNGYIGGHGTRLVFQVASNNDWTPEELLLIKQYNPKIIERVFYITVFNFNPEEISSKSTFGWTAPQNFCGVQTSNQKQFNTTNNVEQISLKGIIYPRGFFALDNYLIDYITSDDAIQDFKDLKFLGSVGTLFSIIEVKTQTRACVLGNWYLLEIEEKSSKFIYANNAKKIEFDFTLEKQIEDNINKISTIK